MEAASRFQIRREVAAMSSISTGHMYIPTLVLEDRQIFGRQGKSQHPGRDNPNRDSNFWQRGEVIHIAHEGWNI